ncbi:unnamed protein product [Amoebophrya sp. A120]|nr:unnamed protein product [Amoebophrya sp. A120]|eukprot:GSA120T00006132001.1
MVIFGCTEYVKHVIGEDFLNYQVDFEKVLFGENKAAGSCAGRAAFASSVQPPLSSGGKKQTGSGSTSTTPVIFVLSSNAADPSAMLHKYAAMLSAAATTTPPHTTTTTSKPTSSATANAAQLQPHKVKLEVISLGQGQGPRAHRMIEQGRREGKWILLQNCHLCKSWMPSLEKLVDVIQADGGENTDPNFRLFLTSMPCDYFPVSLLQNAVKLTTEAPKGVKANLQRSVKSMSDELDMQLFKDLNSEMHLFAQKQQNLEVDGATSTTSPYAAQLLDQKKKHTRLWQKLQLGMRFFHVLIQERRKFGPLGWNVKYDWNESDLEIALANVKNELLSCADVAINMGGGNNIKASSTSTGASSGSASSVMNTTMNAKNALSNLISWDTLQFVIGEINYGGRVTDEFDLRLLKAILEVYLTPSLLKANYKYCGLFKLPPPQGVGATNSAASEHERNASKAGALLSGSKAAKETAEKTASQHQQHLYSVSQFLDFIEAQIPDVDTPDMFGLHPNAVITYQQRESDLLLETILKMQSEGVGGGTTSTVATSSGSSTDATTGGTTSALEVQGKNDVEQNKSSSGPGPSTSDTSRKDGAPAANPVLRIVEHLLENKLANVPLLDTNCVLALLEKNNNVRNRITGTDDGSTSRNEKDTSSPGNKNSPRRGSAGLNTGLKGSPSLTAPTSPLSARRRSQIMAAAAAPGGGDSGTGQDQKSQELLLLTGTASKAKDSVNLQNAKHQLQNVVDKKLHNGNSAATPNFKQAKTGGKINDSPASSPSAAHQSPFRDYATHPVSESKAISSLLTCLYQEATRANKLFLEIRTSLQQLQKALLGYQVMTSELEQTGNELALFQIPEQWRKIAYPTCKKLESFIDDFLDRLDWFGKQWINSLVKKHLREVVANQHKSGAGNSQSSHLHYAALSLRQITPKAFWLSAFFFPQGFLTAVLQACARLYSTSASTTLGGNNNSLGPTVLRSSRESSKTSFNRPAVQGGTAPSLHQSGSSPNYDQHHRVDPQSMISIDNLVFEFQPGEFSDPAELQRDELEMIKSDFFECGILVYGLFLEAAQWDFAQLLLQDQDFGTMYSAAPCIQFQPTLVISGRRDGVLSGDGVTRNHQTGRGGPAGGRGVGDGFDAERPGSVDLIPTTAFPRIKYSDQEEDYLYFRYTCPLYKTVSRKDFVLSVMLDTDQKPNYWVLKGTAMLTMLPD